MSLIKQVEKYKKLMTPENYSKFESFCKQSVNLNAKNTANFNSKDVAEFQIIDLAAKYLNKNQSDGGV